MEARQRLVERLVYGFVFSVLTAGALLAYRDESFFRHQFVVEDGPVEWTTVVGLLLLSGLCLQRAVHLRRSREKLFVTMTALYALVFFFGAGEEISWGQRILGIESSEFFETHNAQGETNLHNLVIGETKLNKLIFAKGVALVFALYLFVMTPLYSRNAGFAALVDRFAIPIPRLHQVLAIIAMLIIVEGLTASSKRGEMTEFAAPLLMLMIFLFPANRKIFLPTEVTPQSA